MDPVGTNNYRPGSFTWYLWVRQHLNQSAAAIDTLKETLSTNVDLSTLSDEDLAAITEIAKQCERSTVAATKALQS